MKKAFRKAILAALVFSLGCLFVSSQAIEDIPKSDFYGTWKMNHDGWLGTLIIKAGGTTKGVKGHYIGGDGIVHAMTGEVNANQIKFAVDMYDTTGNASDDQPFDGYLFSQTKNAIAGTTTWNYKPFGWYATKESDSTELPSPPITTTDFPDPVKGEEQVVVGGSMQLTLTTSKEEYGPEENVRFTLSFTGTTTANLNDCYYIIEYREEQKGIEFYTSSREPFNQVNMSSGQKINWTWDQWDNERQHKAHPGRWRVKFYAPHQLQGGPLVAYFRITS